MASTEETEPSASTAEAPPSHSAEIVAGNDDLLTEIHLRLPLKSLVKFKCVSKHWLSLISHHLDLSLLRKPATGLFLSNPDDVEEGEFDYIDLNPSRRPTALGTSGFRLEHSCNGLLLCYSGGYWSREYHVFNPTSGRHAAIPDPPTNAGMDCFNLAFDPSKSPHYKVVTVRNCTADPSENYIEIYSSETGEWAPSCLGDVPAGWDTAFDQGVFWNGSLHWVFSGWGGCMRYEVESDTMLEMPPTPEPVTNLGFSRRYLVESGGHLHFFDYVVGPGKTRFGVHEMERDYSGWRVKYDVEISEAIRAFPETVSAVTVLGVVRCEAEEESFLVMNVSGRALRYNLKSGSFVKLCDIRTEDLPYSPDVYQYIESLASV